jgi:tungstate transport system substrate-binding protein
MKMTCGVLALCVGLMATVGCGRCSANVVMLATTTSTANTGLLDLLTDEFLKDTGIRVDFIITGTGKALEHGRRGDVDVVLVHAQAAEEAFVREGYGVARVPLMWNDFVILGPSDDPAAISSAPDVAHALLRMSEAQVPFISRSDDSGTHKKETELWKRAGVAPGGDWYIEAGQGMGACLTMANEKSAYILSDRGTYLSRADVLELKVLYEGQPELVNPYAVIAVNPAKHPHVNAAGAVRLIEWLTSPRGQGLIDGYRVNGHQLFHLFVGPRRDDYPFSHPSFGPSSADAHSQNPQRGPGDAGSSPGSGL